MTAHVTWDRLAISPEIYRELPVETRRAALVCHLQAMGHALAGEADGMLVADLMLLSDRLEKACKTLEKPEWGAPRPFWRDMRIKMVCALLSGRRGLSWLAPANLQP